jgi:hypothetical protein
MMRRIHGTEYHMSENLVLGCLTMVVCLAIQCIAVAILLRALLVLQKKGIIGTSLVRISALLGTVMLIMLAGNLLQITLWTGLFCALGEFKDFTTAFYHSVVNFSTLGYGDLVMSPARRLLGALEAANGVLMFGLTSGFLFAILNELMQQEWDKRMGQDGESQSSLHR